MHKENCLSCANRLEPFVESHVQGIFYGKCGLYGTLVKYYHPEDSSLHISELFHNVGKYGCAKFVKQEEPKRCLEDLQTL